MKESNFKYKIEPLSKNHTKNLFKCGNLSLDNYLSAQASQDIKKNVAMTYVLTTKDSENVLGFYTISSIGIFPGELPGELSKKLPRYPVLPGVLLGRLAVSESAQGQNLGQFLLVNALKRSLTVSHQIGIIAVIVEAKNARAINFYKHFGFITFLDNAIRLFLPISTIKELDL